MLNQQKMTQDFLEERELRLEESARRAFAFVKETADLRRELEREKKGCE